MLEKPFYVRFQSKEKFKKNVLYVFAHTEKMLIIQNIFLNVFLGRIHGG